MRTKWEVMRARAVEARMKAEELEKLCESMVNTEFNGKCSGCGVILRTEMDFADHFIVPDERYLNLGHCPTTLKLQES